MKYERRHLAQASTLLSLALLAACQQGRLGQSEQDIITRNPSSAGSLPGADAICPALPADWLENMLAHQRRIMPLDCQRLPANAALTFSWGEPRDRLSGSQYHFQLRRAGAGLLISRSDMTGPRLLLSQSLPAGDYQWAVSYTTSRGSVAATQWRRFSIDAPPSAQRVALAAVGSGSGTVLPDGESLATSVIAKARPRLLPTGSSYTQIAAAAQSADYQPVLNKLRALARLALSQPVPAAPPTPQSAADLAKVLNDRSVRHTARSEREYIEYLAIIGRIDGNTTMLSNARTRLMSLAAWSPDGASSERSNDQANREIYLALAMGLDALWQDLDTAQRQVITAALRSRILQAATGLTYLDREPFDSHGISNVRWINQALLLAAGLQGFPEAQGLLARYWDLSQFTLGTWGDKDGSFGNGIAYGWYNFVSVVPYVAMVRTITGVDLYQLDYLRLAGEQLIAFTAPNIKLPSAFGDETETQDLYANYASDYFRLHAQMTRSALDAWYWQVSPSNATNPAAATVWQLLMLGVNPAPLPVAQAPTQHSWFFPDAGLAAMHLDARQSARTSLFFRSSRFGAYNHSHADQNSLVYVSQGKPLLINSGYYPYYNSPHHKSVTRATRYKNALTFDGGFGQSEAVLGAAKPGDALHSMDTSGEIVYSEVRGNLSAVTGNATSAYRAYDWQAYRWTPLLSNAVRSVVMDRANGIVLVYDWATSAKPRQWELNYHSPNPFNANAATIQATNAGASVCLDRYGPASAFTQTMAWDVPPEVSQPAQAHGRFTMLAPSTELAHLTVLRDGCRTPPIQVQQQGTRIQVILGNQAVVFDKRGIQLSP